MRLLRAIGKFFWRFMVIFSFIVNLILVLVLIGAGILIFEIKNEVAEPLIDGLHSSFVGLDQATIDTIIPVRDEIQVVLDIPIQENTVVVLNEPVPLTVAALIDLPGINAYGVTATVNLTLPQGLELPVALDFNVNVDQPLPISLDVRAVIPLENTQLHDVAENLRLLFEPFSRSLDNLPNNFPDAVTFAQDVLDGNVNLLEPTEDSSNPWPGFSMTAGVNYHLAGEPIPAETLIINTGIVPEGGIPFLDEQIRSELYADDLSPYIINQNAQEALPFTIQSAIEDLSDATNSDSSSTGGAIMTPTSPEDLGIMPTPSPSDG